MRKMLFFLFLSSFVYGADIEARTKKDKKPLPYDHDLFHKEKEVVFFNGEFLYWSLSEDALDFAIEMSHPAWGETQNFAQGNLQRAKTGFHPGLRVAVGYFNAPKYWQVKAEYNWIFVGSHKTSHDPEDNNLFLNSTWQALLPNALQRATSRFLFHYNLANLLVDRSFYPNPHLRMRLFGGLTGGQIKQKWYLTYYDAAFSTHINQKWKFSGAGLRLGITLDWYWGSDFYITGAASLAALLGRYHNHSFGQTNFDPTGSNNINLPFMNLVFNDNRMVYNAQFLFGPSYQKNFKKSRIELFIGYELTPWWNLHEVYRSSSGTPQAAKEIFINNGMTALQGFTGRLTLDF